MRCLFIKSKPGFGEWRQAARQCLADGLTPQQVLWQPGEEDEQQTNLLSYFEPDAVSTEITSSFKISKNFLELAHSAICHNSPDRFNLLYRVLWRLLHENKNLLNYQTDPDIITLTELVKAVRRDAYKIKAFLRFREVVKNEEPYFIAWHEPEHYTLELSLSFFKTRFKNMNWCILTPYLAAHWDGETLTLNENPDPNLKPEADEIERYWLQYYASTFNPARVKVKAMLSQMPKKYWKNMPETVLIKGLLDNAAQRVQQMLELNPPAQGIIEAHQD